MPENRKSQVKFHSRNPAEVARQINIESQGLVALTNAEAQELREQAWAMRQNKRFDEALILLKDAWNKEADPAGRARLIIDAAWTRIGLGHYEKAIKLASFILEKKAWPHLNQSAERVLRAAEKRRYEERELEARVEVSHSEREALESENYFKASRSPGFVSAQKRWLRDCGLLDD